MKIVDVIDVINSHLFYESEQLAQYWEEVRSAIHATDWPHGSGAFTIYPESGKKRGKGNGVKPIKIPCMRYLQSCGWQVEGFPSIGSDVLGTGDLDALKRMGDEYVIFEWETGNISSSHRAINKILHAMLSTPIAGSFMVVPSDSLKMYLTDRIGNIGELRPYLSLFRGYPNIRGAFRLIVVEHDAISLEVPKIPKGRDGYAEA
jgi:hypothetical protein